MNKTPATLTDAEKIAQEFKQFAYTVSHDLSTPLRGIVEFSKLLKTEAQESLNGEAKEYLALIVESGEKMQAMMAGLLDYSRLNTMRKPATRVNCNSILSDCQVVLRDKIQASKCTLDIAALPTITADAEQLMQLFLLLLDNALKFHATDIAPYIAVSAEHIEDEWQFLVNDNGIGIETQFHTRIFKPFQRLHGEDEYQGVGMGLTLAQKIVERHGGRIWVESNPQQGVSFIFTMPADKGQA